METGLETYDLKIANLTNGSHHFRYEINDDFFAHFSESLIRHGNCKVDVDLEKNNSTFDLHIRCTGDVEVTCDRCLTPFRRPTECEYTIILKMSHANLEDAGEEIEIIAPGTIKINLACYIYECMQLSLPLQVFCDQQPGNSCDKEVLEFLEKLKISSSEKSFVEAFKDLRLKQ